MAVRMSRGVFHNWSISRRLSLWYSLSILLLLGVFATITYAEFHRSIHSDFDQHLLHETSLLLPQISVTDDLPAFTEPDALYSTAYQTSGIHSTYVRLLSRDGIVLATSPNFQILSGLEVELPPEPRKSTRSVEWEGSPLRTLYNPLVDQSAALIGWLEVSGIEWAVHQQLNWLIQIYLAGIGISALMAFGGGFLLARRALRPVEEITTAAKNIRTTDLSSRLPTRFGVNDELTRLAETVNDLLGRLEDSIKREQRFISNATHELLTPLTTLRGELDLARRNEADTESAELLDIALNDIDRMERIIRSLLALSRAENLTSAPRSWVQLERLFEEHVSRFKDRADVHGIEVNLSIEKNLRVLADTNQIGTVLDNLLDNAMKYTPKGGQISINARSRADGIIVEVTDSGIGFTVGTAERMFDRFYRADESEVKKEAGSGLGLAIAKAIVEAYGGQITGRSQGLGQGATFSVNFPLGQ